MLVQKLKYFFLGLSCICYTSLTIESNFSPAQFLNEEINFFKKLYKISSFFFLWQMANIWYGFKDPFFTILCMGQTYQLQFLKKIFSQWSLLWGVLFKDSFNGIWLACLICSQENYNWDSFYLALTWNYIHLNYLFTTINESARITFMLVWVIAIRYLDVMLRIASTSRIKCVMM